MTFDVPGDAAWDIVAGPDGNLWYTAPEGNDSKIGAASARRRASAPQYDVTDAGDQLGITVGPDGALWFAQAVANDIGRMTLDGQFSEVKGGITAAARPEYIAPGPEQHAVVHREGRQPDRSDHRRSTSRNGGPPPPR